jgi:ribosome-associated protein
LALVSSAVVPTSPPNRSLERALAAARTADLSRGRDITILDLRGVTSVFDYFVIVTGQSRRQLHAISEEIDRVMQNEYGDERLGLEGYQESRWILLDFGDIVVHMFDAETRDYYGLEHLWSAADRVPYEPMSPPATLPESRAL